METFKSSLFHWLKETEPDRANALVYGEGPLKPRIMLIGEAPGEQETVMGRPFVGKAGKNLDHFLELAGLKREEIYVTNVVKVRPTKIGRTGRIGNRPPTHREIELFKPWLFREIEMISPKLIVTLGNVPLQTVTEEKITIGTAHGQLRKSGRYDISMYALYHPASIIYNRALSSIYEEDVMRLAEILSTKSDD